MGIVTVFLLALALLLFGIVLYQLWKNILLTKIEKLILTVIVFVAPVIGLVIAFRYQYFKLMNHKSRTTI